jgi:hypothetical protein
MKLRRSLYARPEIIRGQQCTRARLPFFERPVTTGDPEAFAHGVRPSSVSNLSAQPPRSAMRSLVRPSQPRLLSWGDVVRIRVPEGTVWGPHSLHTAEAIGSNLSVHKADGGLECHGIAWGSHDLPHGAPLLGVAANAATRASHTGTTAQAQPSPTTCHRSKSAICCGRLPRSPR